MKTLKFFLSFALLTGLIIACQKEMSFEAGQGGTVSDGSLQGAGGACLGSVVNGIYKADSTLIAGHNVDVKVDVLTPGTYLISSDTVNGMYFRATGTFTATGVNTVKLQGFGKPIAAGVNTFNVTYDSTTCTFTITTLPASGGGGGGGTAFTITCGNAVDSLTIGSAPTSTDTVRFTVNVTTVGPWSATSSAAQNVTYSGSGTFTSTGAQTITLAAVGTPNGVAGTVNFTVTVGTTTCTFPVTFVTTPPPVIDYYPRTTNSNWSYEFDDLAFPEDTMYKYVIANTLTANSNVYNIFMYEDDFGIDTFGYYRKSGTDYYSWMNIGYYLGADNDVWGDFNFLDHNLNANATWNSANFNLVFSGIPATVRIRYTIQQKDVPVSITSSTGTVSHPNTIVVREDYEYDAGGGNWQPLFDAGAGPVYALLYYTRNIGQIQLEFRDNSGALYKEELRRYQVF